MVGKETTICVIGNDVEGILYIEIPDEESRAWHPSTEFVIALKKEFGRQKELSSVKQIEAGYKALIEEEAAESVDRKLEKLDGVE